MKLQRLLIPTLLIFCAAVGWWQWGPEPKVEDAAATTDSGETGSVLFEGLDKAKQKEIWDAEHFTFEIETHVGRKLVSQLQERSHEALAGFYLADFSGAVPQRSSAVTVKKSSLIETSYTTDVTDRSLVDAEGFSNYLIEGIQAIPKDGKGRFRVLKIARAKDDDSDDAWQLSVLLTLGGTNAAGEPVAYVSHGSMRCRFSDDEDIVAGRIIESWHVDSESLRSSQQALMEEATAQVGLDKISIADNWKIGRDSVRQYRFQTAVEDFNSDGFPDIAIATADQQTFLLQWDPDTGQYEDVAESLGLSKSISSENRAYMACWIDYNNDGHIDLILGESLFENVDGKSFKRVANNGALKFAFNPMGCVVADYDADGLPDLYVLYQRDRNPSSVGNDKPPAWVGDDESGAYNQLWRNRGDGTFEEKSRTANATSGRRHSFAATWLHANDDHYPDLYVANDFARNSLLINQGDGSFKDVADASGVGDFATSMGVASGDIDGDGAPEIYVANMYSKMGRRIIAQVSADDYPEGIYEQLVGSCAGNRLYSTKEDVQAFQELSEQLGVNAVGWAYAPAFADFDSDGMLDLYATTGFLSFNRHKPDG